MKQFLYRVQPIRAEMLEEGPTERESKIIEEHFAYLQHLVGKGTVLMAGRTLNEDDSSFGIVVFETDSESQAEAIMEGDPVVKGRVMQAQIFPYRIALWSASGPSE